MIQKPHALVLSPSATHPQDYGNRNRVWQVTNFLKEIGYGIDFLLYPIEAEWNECIPPEADSMRLAWDSFWVVPPSIPLHARAAGAYHHIDEWWDPAIGSFLEWLFARRSYDLFVVNYTFLSRAFIYAPKSTLRVLETHDVFSGRKEMLAALGVAPEFFYTTRDQEKIAFDRADIVVAIKDSEARLIEGMTDGDVVSLPFFPSRPKAVPKRPTGFSGLSVGFIGAGNSVNIGNFQSFLNQFDPLVRLYCPPLRLVVAGGVCKRLWTDNPAFELLGRVADVDDFYAQVDVVVAPMMFSTGIKIKVAEALAHGKGVVSTVNGFDGFPAIDPMHASSSIEEVCRSLIALSFDKQRCEALIERSRMAAEAAKQSTATALQTLAQMLRGRSRRVVFVTDRPYWVQPGFLASRLAQWVQLCAAMTRIVVCYLDHGDHAGRSAGSAGPPDLFEIDVSRLDAADAPAEVVRQLEAGLRQIGHAEIIVSVNKPWGKGLHDALVDRGHAPILDLWCPPLSEIGRRAGIAPESDIWFSGLANGQPRGDGIEASAVRWTPIDLQGWAEAPIGRRAVIVWRRAAVEARWIDADLRRVLDARGVECDLVTVGEDENEVEMLYAHLQTRDRPLLILTIAASAQLRHSGKALGTIGNVPFFSIDRDSFPLALADRAGRIEMVHSCSALVEKVIALHDAGTGPRLAVHAIDAGWSRFWQVMEQRLNRPIEVEAIQPGSAGAALFKDRTIGVA